MHFLGLLFMQKESPETIKQYSHQLSLVPVSSSHEATLSTGQSSPMSSKATPTQQPSADGHVYINNLTLINLALYWFGPQKESHLTKILLVFQLGVCSVAFILRYELALLFYRSQ